MFDFCIQLIDDFSIKEKKYHSREILKSRTEKSLILT